MMTPRFLSILLLALPALACDHEPLPEGADDSSRYFDGVDVADELAADSERVFFVDLSDGSTYTFDEVEEDIAFDHFIVRCPSMPQPIPMLDYFDIIGFEGHGTERAWTLRAVDGGDQFRVKERCEPFMCDAYGNDCGEICWTDAR